MQFNCKRLTAVKGMCGVGVSGKQWGKLLGKKVRPGVRMGKNLSTRMCSGSREGRIKVAEDDCSELSDQDWLHRVIHETTVFSDLSLNVRKLISVLPRIVW